jgi:putative sigma-54 modulation protein
MRTTVMGRNLDVGDADRAYIEDKLRRVERLLDDRSEAIVELSRERHRSEAASHIVEVTLVIDGRPLRSVGRASSHRAATDAVVDRLERRVVEQKERPRDRGRAERRGTEVRGPSSVSGTATPPGTDTDARRIVKVKRFAIEPMFEEDAVERMEELEHSFFLFVNAETERVALLYRRDDGDYGLIEPTIGGSYGVGQERRGVG